MAVDYKDSDIRDRSCLAAIHRRRKICNTIPDEMCTESAMSILLPDRSCNKYKGVKESTRIFGFGREIMISKK